MAQSTMARVEEIEALTNAFSGGLGVDEKLLISVLGKAHPHHRKSFRKENPQLFNEDERSFERCDDHGTLILKHEFSRFEYASVMWAMHPWERDARLIQEALKEGPQSYGVIVEIACTRSSEELLGARKAYHSLFHHSIEEEIATHISGKRKLLVALVSAYRYEGPKVKDDTAKSEAKIIAHAIRNGAKKTPMEDDDVTRILATRSKIHLKSIYKHYKDICGKSIIEDLEAAHDLILKETVECLCTPHVYFSKAMDEAMRKDADSRAKNALTRVIVTQADGDLKEITKQYQSLYGVPLSKKVEAIAKGNYKDFLLALIAKQN